MNLKSWVYDLCTNIYQRLLSINMLVELYWLEDFELLSLAKGNRTDLQHCPSLAQAHQRQLTFYFSYWSSHFWAHSNSSNQFLHSVITPSASAKTIHLEIQNAEVWLCGQLTLLSYFLSLQFLKGKFSPSCIIREKVGNFMIRRARVLSINDTQNKNNQISFDML